MPQADSRDRQPAPGLGAIARALARFRRDQKGATAVEFAIVALPFLALLFTIIETALIFLMGQVLEGATANSARLIRTGQMQQQAKEQDAAARQWRPSACGDFGLPQRAVLMLTAVVARLCERRLGRD